MTAVKVKSGLDVLLASKANDFKGKAIGLVTHAAAVNCDLKNIVDCFLELDLPITKIFAPEHGFTGAAQDMIHVGQETYKSTGIPIISLYGSEVSTLTPQPQELKGLDAIIVDMQDVGSRYYTFAQTMAYTKK